jgi:hypothetical protein
MPESDDVPPAPADPASLVPDPALPADPPMPAVPAPPPVAPPDPPDPPVVEPPDPPVVPPDPEAPPVADPPDPPVEPPDPPVAPPDPPVEPPEPPVAVPPAPAEPPVFDVPPAIPSSFEQERTKSDNANTECLRMVHRPVPRDRAAGVFTSVRARGETSPSESRTCSTTSVNAVSDVVHGVVGSALRAPRCACASPR